MALKGDYIGFTYNGIHSSDLGIIRVSGGDRYEEELLPEIEEITVDVPNSNGTYFFGSRYKTRQMAINFAFGFLTETELRRIQRLYGDQKLHPLIFDEAPYKQYLAKVTEPPNFNFVAFDEKINGKGKKQKVFKGEGTLTFTCYEPFARSRRTEVTGTNGIKMTKPLKYIEDFNYQTIPEWNEISNRAPAENFGVKETAGLTGNGENAFNNLDEWVDSFNFISNTDKKYDYPIANSNGEVSVLLHNAGDLDTYPLIIIPFQLISGSTLNLTLNSYMEDGTTVALSYLKLTELENTNNDYYIIIDMKKRLIYGTNQQRTKKHTIFNRNISSGNFFAIPGNKGHDYKIVFSGLSLSKVEVKVNESDKTGVLDKTGADNGNLKVNNEELTLNNEPSLSVSVDEEKKQATIDMNDESESILTVDYDYIFY